MTAQMVRNIAKDAWVDAIEILKLVEILETGNTSVAVAAIDAAGTDDVVQCIYRALWSRLVMIVTRAYADARPGDRHAQYAFDLLKDSAVRSEIEKIGDRAILDEAIALWAKCRGDHRRESIDGFRDKQIAHWGALKNPPPIINDVLKVSRATASALERLAQGTGVVSLTLKSQLVGYQDKAKRFWA
jgi:hypothetical protein